MQLNVRQSDKNIPFNLYPNKSFWHRFAFSIGYTVSNVAEEGKREDFFERFLDDRYRHPLHQRTPRYGRQHVVLP